MSSDETQRLIKQKQFKKWIAIGCLVATGAGITVIAMRVLKQDPLATFKRTLPDELPDSVAIRSTDSQFNHYDEGKPKTSCNVKTIEVAQNRQMYTFTGISNGKLEWKDAMYHFNAERGSWNGFVKKLVLSGASKFKGKNFDLSSDELTYDENQRTLNMIHPVTGSAFGGKLSVASFTYELDTEAFKAGKGEWKGIPSGEMQKDVPVQTNRTIWDFTAEDTEKKPEIKDVTFYTKVRATDGDIILIAPKMEVNSKTDVMTATGRVQYFGTKANLIADKIVIYRKEKRAVLTGNVTMLVKPKDKQEEPAKEVELSPLPPAVPDSISSTRPPAPDDQSTKKKEEEIRSTKNLRQYPLIILAPAIEYWYKKGERHAIITGNPQARQDLPESGWRYVWADNAKYDGEKELLALFSAPTKKDVIMKNSVGDEMYAESGVLSTKEDDDTYSFKKSRGKSPVHDDDLPASDKKKGDGTTGTGKGTDKDKGKGGGGLNGPIGHKA